MLVGYGNYLICFDMFALQLFPIFFKQSENAFFGLLCGLFSLSI